MRLRKENAVLKWTLIITCELFLALFLILPLVFILETAFAQGLAAYWNSITDQYAIKAALLTLRPPFGRWASIRSSVFPPHGA